MLHPDKWETNAFTHEFAFMVIAWNHLEQTAQQMLLARLGGSNEAWMVVAEMGNRALPNAIKATSKTLDRDELIADIDHFLKGYELLLAKRNHWVHSLLGVVPENQNSPNCEGWLKAVSAKGTLKYTDGRVSSANLAKFFEQATAFSNFGTAILNELQGESELWAAMRDRLGKPPPSLERPPLPDALDKQTREVPKHWLQPESSAE
jgi:hypothetical protein